MTWIPPRDDADGERIEVTRGWVPDPDGWADGDLLALYWERIRASTLPRPLEVTVIVWQPEAPPPAECLTPSDVRGRRVLR
jgi:hypothetical protein